MNQPSNKHTESIIMWIPKAFSFLGIMRQHANLGKLGRGRVRAFDDFAVDFGSDLQVLTWDF